MNNTSFFQFLYNLWFTGWMGLILYWLPLSLCVTGYTVRTMENYRKDTIQRQKRINYLALKKSKEQEGGDVESINSSLRVYYNPTDKIGTLLGRALVSICPIANLWASVFDVFPNMFGKILSTIEKIFDTPLVPSPD